MVITPNQLNSPKPPRATGGVPPIITSFVPPSMMSQTSSHSAMVIPRKPAPSLIFDNLSPSRNQTTDAHASQLSAISTAPSVSVDPFWSPPTVNHTLAVPAALLPGSRGFENPFADQNPFDDVNASTSRQHRLSAASSLDPSEGPKSAAVSLEF